jgi:RNA polymerase sigma-54 factor
MEQGLIIQQGQRMTMNVQMQQAVKILQLSAAELHDAVEKEFLENPALEYDERAASDTRYTFEEIARLKKFLKSEPVYGAGNDESEQHSFEAVAQIQPTLEEILAAQVNLTFSAGKKRDAAHYIVGLIDEHGYLRATSEEIARFCAISAGEAEELIRLIQNFEPDGVGARSLEECLAIQSRQKGIYGGVVKELIDKHLELVAHGKFKRLAELLNVSPKEVQSAVDLIKRLNPKPGLAYSANEAQYIVPDLVIKELDGKFCVFMNEYGMQGLHIKNIMPENSNVDKDTKKYIENRVNAAVWLLRNIEHRRQTIRKVAEEIVRLQPRYFEGGEGYLRPMLMKEVADNIGVHESTVSRAVANKYAATPFGMRSLKSFFSANLAQPQSGEAVIAAQIKQRIGTLVEKEDAHKPLSDQQLADILKNEGMAISRRTVVKYREQLGIASSMKRKRY